MIVTSSNVLKGTTPTITSGASSDLPANITSEDFSENYTSTNDQWLVVEFGATTSIDYVAVSGVLVKGDSSGSSFIRLNDGATAIQTVYLKRDQTVVFNFTRRAFSNLTVTFYNGAANQGPTVSYIAAGDAVTIPNNGETAGHKRQWLERNIKTRTTVNNISAPIALLKKTIQGKGRLNIPNALATFSRDEWQTFLTFAEDNLFFINEVQSLPESSYCCYDLDSATVTAHQQTRTLNNMSISFKVFV